MAGELRWILLGLSALLLLGILWWGARRSRQAPGNAQLRESSTSAYIPPEPSPTVGDAQRWGVSPLEPLSIRTADFEPVSMTDMSMTATRDPVEVDEPLAVDSKYTSLKPASAPATAAAPGSGTPSIEPPSAHESTDTLRTADASTAAAAPSAAAAPASAPTASEAQRIVTIRVSAAGDLRWWGGAEVISALEKHGLQYGRYKVFHRKHDDGRTLFCAASLVEPGTFDLPTMPEQEFRGLTLFAVLPGPIDAVETVDTLILTADAIARTLAGTVQDSQGAPLNAERIILMRDDAARFQASLAIH